tara:strand:- start:378 stop:602 length:225 start_codon:yes stop_codon:yes gene_type:complete
MQHCLGVDVRIDIFKISLGVAFSEKPDQVLDLLLAGVVAKLLAAFRPDSATTPDVSLCLKCLVVLNGLLDYLAA